MKIKHQRLCEKANWREANGRKPTLREAKTALTALSAPFVDIFFVEWFLLGARGRLMEALNQDFVENHRRGQARKNLAVFRYHIFLRNNEHWSSVVLFLRKYLIFAPSNLFGSIREGAGADRRLKESASFKLGYKFGFSI